MSHFLMEEEMPVEQGLLVKAASRAARSKSTYTVLLRSVKVLNNKALFGTSDVIVYAVTIDGFPDMKDQQPFWVQQFSFPGVRDGARLEGIDPQEGVAVYRGRPSDFLNLYFLVVRDKESTRDLAKLLKENMIAEGIGTIAGAAISTFANLPPGITVPVARDTVKKAVDTTLDVFSRQKNLAIGTLYASLLSEREFGLGLHPPGFPPKHLKCGDALELAYEVRKSP